MATKFEYGCPTCGRKFFGPVAPLVPGSDPGPSNHCCGCTWDFRDAARFQWDPLTEMRVLSVLTQEEQMRELRKTPREAAEKFAPLMIQRRRGRLKCDESTEPLTLRWLSAQ